MAFKAQDDYISVDEMTLVLNSQWCPKVCVVLPGETKFVPSLSGCESGLLRVLPAVTCPFRMFASNGSFKFILCWDHAWGREKKKICGCQVRWEVINQGGCVAHWTASFADLYLTCGRGRPGQAGIQDGKCLRLSKVCAKCLPGSTSHTWWKLTPSKKKGVLSSHCGSPG